jgi:hypothetical protein
MIETVYIVGNIVVVLSMIYATYLLCKGNK